MLKRLNTGSTGAVALMLGRKYNGYLLEPKHNSFQVGRFEATIKKYNQAELKKAAQT
jgi:hypothetical protein